MVIPILPSSVLMMEIYEQMWREATAAFRRGEPQLDPHLLDKASDSRRGVTLVFRPSAAVQGRVAEFLSRLKTACPGQYFYAPEEWHVTVISLVTMTEQWREEFKPLDEYRRLIAKALVGQPKFRMRFHGITASPSAVVIQGFPEGDTLHTIREDLRLEFSQAGIKGVLDRRYKIAAAHMSVMRFCRPEIDWQRLLPLLEEARTMDFGAMEVERLQLIQGDWYASAGVTQTLDEHELRTG